MITMFKHHNIDRRKQERVGFETQVVLNIGQAQIQVAGNSRDLSLGGIFVNTAEPAPKGVKCKVRVVLTGTQEQFHLEMVGRVVRREERGLAIEFDVIDLDSYTHLKKIVSYNITRPRRHSITM